MRAHGFRECSRSANFTWAAAEDTSAAPLPGSSAALGALGSITATCYHVVPLRGPVSRPPTGIRHVEQKAEQQEAVEEAEAQ